MPRLLPALTFSTSTALLPVLGALHYALLNSDMASAFAQSASLVSAFTLASFAYSVLAFLLPSLSIRPYLLPPTHFTILATLGVFGTAAMTSLSRWRDELAAITTERVWIQMIGVTKGEAWAHASVQRFGYAALGLGWILVALLVAQGAVTALRCREISRVQRRLRMSQRLSR